MAKISFLYKNLLSSAQFNERFGDIFGGSILSGFNLGKGTQSNAISILTDNDTASVLITKDGVRIEESEDVINAVSYQENQSADKNRLDSIYLKYIHGSTPDSVVSYVLVEGNENGTPAPLMDETFYTFIGYVEIPPVSSGAAPVLSVPTKGMNLKDISNQPLFKNGLESSKNISIKEEPILDDHATNKKFVAKQIEESKGSLSSLNVYASEYDEEQRVFKELEYRKKDGTLHMRSVLSDPNSESRPQKIQIEFYDESGQVKETEEWNLTYDLYGNIISKVLL